MVRSALNKVAWVGRTASMVFGLALVMALVVGAASTAWSATGGNFILGKFNAAETPTSLVSTLTDAIKPALNVQNKSGGPALNLRVGNATTPANSVAPMKVNSTKKVANLNADRIDDREASSFANATHDHAGEAITSGTVAEGRIDGSITRDSEVMPTVKANDGSGSGVDADTLDGQSSGTFASSTHNHDGRYYSSGSKVADSDKLDGKDSSAFGIWTAHAQTHADNCDTPDIWNECAPVTVTVPEGKNYIVSVWSSFSAKDSGGPGSSQLLDYCSAGKGPSISTTNPCITPFGTVNTVTLHDWLVAASSSGESVSLSPGTYTFFTALSPRDREFLLSNGRVITKVMVRDATNGL